MPDSIFAHRGQYYAVGHALTKKQAEKLAKEPGFHGRVYPGETVVIIHQTAIERLARDDIGPNLMGRLLDLAFNDD